jgi:hypothetical protein
MPHHLRKLDISINYLRGNGTAAPIKTLTNLDRSGVYSGKINRRFYHHGD